MSKDVIENKKKQQKAEDFIGWRSPDGKLEVIGIIGKQGSATTFKVTCTECSKDKELFPDGYFVSTKGALVKGVKPCGCSKIPKWKPWQFLILARRAAKARFIVHGFAEEFKNQRTKLNLECLKDGYKWTANINSVMVGHGCPMCVLATQNRQNKRRCKNVLTFVKKWTTMLLVLKMDIKMLSLVLITSAKFMENKTLVMIVL